MKIASILSVFFFEIWFKQLRCCIRFDEAIDKFPIVSFANQKWTGEGVEGIIHFSKFWRQHEHNGANCFLNISPKNVSKFKFRQTNY